MAGSLGEANISRDYALEYLISKEAAQVGGNLLRECSPVVIHRQEDALDRKVRIDGSTDAHVRVEKLGNALNCKILALDRDEDGVGCGKRIQRQQVQGGWAVDYHERIPAKNRTDGLFQAVFAIVHRDELNGGAHQVLIGRNDIEPVDLGVNRDSFDGLIQHERLVEGATRRILREPERTRGIGLGIAVDD